VDRSSREGPNESPRKIERHDLGQRERRRELPREAVHELPSLFASVALVINRKAGFLEAAQVPHHGAAAAAKRFLDLTQGAAPGRLEKTDELPRPAHERSARHRCQAVLVVLALNLSIVSAHRESSCAVGASS
jgi:hypothetical protein